MTKMHLTYSIVTGQLWVNGVRKSKSNKNREVVEQWLRDTREALHKEFHNHG